MGGKNSAVKGGVNLQRETKFTRHTSERGSEKQRSSLRSGGRRWDGGPSRIVNISGIRNGIIRSDKVALGSWPRNAGGRAA